MDITIASGDYEKQEREWDGVKRTSFAQWAQLQQGGFVLSFLVQHQRGGSFEAGSLRAGSTSFSTKNGRLSVERVRLKPLRAVSKPA